MSDVMEFESFELVRKASAGINKAKIYILKNSTDKTNFLIKQASLNSAINEYVGSSLARIIMGNNAPLVTFVQDKNGVIYTASRFIAGFKTLEEFLIDNNLPKECLNNGCITEADGSIAIVNAKHNTLAYPIISKQEEFDITMHLVKHREPHCSNKGFSIIGNNIEAALIDYDMSLLSGSTQHVPKKYIRSDNLEKVYPVLEKICSLDIPLIVKNLFISIRTAYQKEIDQNYINSQENLITEFLLSNQRKLNVDKEILHFILETDHTNEDWVELKGKINGELECASKGAKIQLNKINKAQFKELFSEEMNYETNQDDQFTEYYSVSDLVRFNKKEKFTSQFKFVDKYELSTALEQSVIYNRIEMFKAIINHNHNLYFNESFLKSIKLQRIEMFKILLPLLDELEMQTLEAAMNEGSHQMFDALISKMVHSEVCKNYYPFPFEEAKEDGQLDFLAKMNMARENHQEDAKSLCEMLSEGYQDNLCDLLGAIST